MQLARRARCYEIFMTSHDIISKVTIFLFTSKRLAAGCK